MKSGEKVKLYATSRYFYQSEGSEYGIILYYCDNKNWVRVKWISKNNEIYTDNYPIDDLYIYQEDKQLEFEF